jgi:hypothetical protein
MKHSNNGLETHRDATPDRNLANPYIIDSY